MNKYISKIYWTFYPHIDGKVVYLQRFLYGFNLSEEAVLNNYGLSVKYVNYNSDSDLQQWCDIINNSYDDCFFDIPKARKFLLDHLIFKDGKTALFIKDAFPCATVSWGTYRDNSNVGGDYRIGVHNNFKGNGLGRMCVEYAFSRLAEQGIRLGESIITIKRVPSLLLHFSLGFEPQYDVRYVSFKKNLKHIGFVQRVRLTYLLYKYHNIYKKKLKKSFQ